MSQQATEQPLEVLPEIEDIIEVLARKVLGGDEAHGVMRWVNAVREERAGEEPEADAAAPAPPGPVGVPAAGATHVAAPVPAAAAFDPNTPGLLQPPGAVPGVPAVPVPVGSPAGGDSIDAELAQLRAMIEELTRPEPEPDPRLGEIAELKALAQQLIDAKAGGAKCEPAPRAAAKPAAKKPAAKKVAAKKTAASRS